MYRIRAIFTFPVVRYTEMEVKRSRVQRGSSNEFLSVVLVHNIILFLRNF